MSDGAEHRPVAGIAEICAWETKYNKKISDWSNGIALTDMAYLAWQSMTNDNLTAFKFDQWLKNVETIESAETDDPKATDGAA
jgi:hypothetical protein